MDQPQEPFQSSDSDSSVSVQSKTTCSEVTESIRAALRFIDSVKVGLGGDSEEFKEFRQLMKDYKYKRTNIKVVRTRIKLLFQEHPELVAGFNTFLPAGYEISMAVQKNHSVSNAFEEAIRFVNKVKVEYMHDERRYASFLNVLNGYRSKEKSIKEVFEEVCILFHDRPDLIVNFLRFLPDTSNSTTPLAVHQTELNRRSKKMRKICILFALLLVSFGLGVSLGFALSKS